MSELWNRRWEKTQPLLDRVSTSEAADALTHSTEATSAAGYYTRVEATLRHCVGEPQSALDVGCGTGHWSEFLHDDFGIPYEHITAIDVAQQPVDYVRRRCPGIDARVLDISSESLPDGYDVAVAIGVLHHVVTAEGLSVAMSNMLAAAQRIVVYPVRKDDEVVKAADSGIKRFWRRTDYLAALSAGTSDFVEVELPKRPRWLVLSREEALLAGEGGGPGRASRRDA